MKEKTMYNECYSCQNKREVPGNTHIKCVDPDPDMTGHKHGIEKGWYVYPVLFDPVWKTNMCSNYIEGP